MPKGSTAWVSAYVAPSVKRAGVYLTFTKGPIGDRMYAALRDDKDEIERALGVPVEWESDGSEALDRECEELRREAHRGPRRGAADDHGGPGESVRERVPAAAREAGAGKRVAPAAE